jgi:hypothetical protein
MTEHDWQGNIEELGKSLPHCHFEHNEFHTNFSEVVTGLPVETQRTFSFALELQYPAIQ